VKHDKRAAWVTFSILAALLLLAAGALYGSVLYVSESDKIKDPAIVRRTADAIARFDLPAGYALKFARVNDTVKEVIVAPERAHADFRIVLQTERLRTTIASRRRSADLGLVLRGFKMGCYLRDGDKGIAMIRGDFQLVQMKLCTNVLGRPLRAETVTVPGTDDDALTIYAYGSATDFDEKALRVLLASIK
jgi:hypothetical protein